MRIVKLFVFFLLTLAVAYSSQPAQTTAVYAAPNADVVLNLGGDRIRHASPAAADFDNDGFLEIVLGTYDGRLIIVSTSNGSSWSVADSIQVANAINTQLPAGDRQSTGRIESAPAIGDIDNDGALEIVVTTGGFPDSSSPSTNKHGAIIAYEVSNSLQLSLKSGWPFLALDAGGQGAGGSTPDGIRDGIWSTPALGDLNGDGDLEIVALGLDRHIYALEHTGTAVPGWPISRANGDPLLRGGWSSPAMADIDSDGLPEIIVGTDSPPWNGDDRSGPFPSQYDTPDYTKSTVWAINGDSTLVPGWPTITTQQVQSSPAIGDIDGDGDLEIVVGTGLGIAGSGGQKVYAWHHDGSAVSGWPRPTGGNMSASPALADLTNDGIVDVIIGCGAESAQGCKTLYAWTGSGSDVPGFPLTPTNISGQQQAQPYPPIVADIDNDNQPEILQTMANSVALTVIEHNGTANGDFSRKLQPSSNTILATPLVADVDNDGKLETVFGAENNGQAALYIFDESGNTDSNSTPWPAFQRNMLRTSAIEPPILSFPDELRFFHQQGTGNTAVLAAAVKNIGGETFNWELNESIVKLSADANSGTIATSQAVTFSLNTTGFANDTWHTVGTFTVSATANGIPVQGSPKTVTVYLYVGNVSFNYLPTVIK